MPRKPVNKAASALKKIRSFKKERAKKDDSKRIAELEKKVDAILEYLKQLKFKRG